MTNFDLWCVFIEKLEKVDLINQIAIWTIEIKIKLKSKFLKFFEGKFQINMS